MEYLCHSLDDTDVQATLDVRRWYEKADLLGRLVVCVTNFPARRIATFDSEVLTLGAIEPGRRVVLLLPDADTALGSPIG